MVNRVLLLPLLIASAAFAGEKDIQQALTNLSQADPSKHLEGRKQLQALSLPDKRIAAERLLAELRSGKEGLRWSAIQGLGALGPVNEEVIPELYKAFKNPRTDSSALIALQEVGPEAASVLVPELKNRLSNWRFGISRALDSMPVISPDFLPALTEALAEQDFDDEGHLSSVISKIDPARASSVPVMVRAYKQTEIPEDGKRDRIFEALDRMSVPEAKRAVWMFRWQRRLWVILLSGPIALLALWPLWRLVSKFKRSGTLGRFVLTPVCCLAFVIAAIPLLATVHGVWTGRGAYLVALHYLLSGSLFVPLITAPSIALAILLIWAGIGLQPLWSKGQSRDRVRLSIGSLSLVCFAGLLLKVILSGHYFLPVGP